MWTCSRRGGEQGATSKSGVLREGCVVHGRKRAGGPFQGLSQSCSCSLCTRDHVATLQTSSYTTNPLATANIDVPRWRCCTTSAPSVGCSCCLLLPSGEGSIQDSGRTMRGGQWSVCTSCKNPFFTGMKKEVWYMESVHGDCDQNNMRVMWKEQIWLWSGLGKIKTYTNVTQWKPWKQN